jgi:two-component sensor histidine kinase
LQALSRVQSLLARAEDRGIDLHSLVTAELAAYGDTGLPSGKIQVGGAAVTLPPMAAQAIGLALHELATNAVKYGALAQPAGRLVVRWEFQQEGFDPWVSIQWQESGVLLPPITGASQRRGYGRELIERALPYQMRAKTSLSFGPEGVHCEIRVPVADKEEAHG